MRRCRRKAPAARSWNSREGVSARANLKCSTYRRTRAGLAMQLAKGCSRSLAYIPRLYGLGTRIRIVTRIQGRRPIVVFLGRPHAEGTAISTQKSGGRFLYAEHDDAADKRRECISALVKVLTASNPAAACGRSRSRDKLRV